MFKINESNKTTATKFFQLRNWKPFSNEGNKGEIQPETENEATTLCSWDPQ